ncbi:MAG: ATP-binding cassette domain-containing protein [Eubacteriales bacterium]|nr:ATP-binding cassette domain-containing protein [Eubacteriales bacterium]
MSEMPVEKNAPEEGLWQVSWQDISKSYGKRRFLSGISGSATAPGSYGLTGKSGSGKTTFLRLLMGLEKPDTGRFLWERIRQASDQAGPSGKTAAFPRAAAVFQEDRLCEAFTAEENIRLILKKGGPGREEIRRELLSVLPEDCLLKPVGKLSGGQKRRVAVVRAMIAPDADYIVLDEPFTGLDAQTKERVIAYIKERKRDRLLFIAAHEAEEFRAFSIAPQNLLSFSSVSENEE